MEFALSNRTVPSIFAIAVVFGGTTGMTAASLFGADGGGGFVVGFACLFVILAIASALSRNIDELTEAVVSAQETASEAKQKVVESLRLTTSHGN